MSIPEQIGKYRIDLLLASGGMGEVFLAHVDGPAGFSKSLVVKRILPHLATDERSVKMFLNEARLAALLSHPNVVQIFELGQDDDSYFLAMEYIHGRSLRSILGAMMQGGQAVDATFVAYVAAQALHGLHYAHSLKDAQGAPLFIVHRDVTPENILVGFEGAVKVVDFGIAKAMRPDATQITGLVGKRRYMSPEQLRFDAVDARADVYAMGIVLYEALTGKTPFEQVPVAELLVQIAAGAIPPHARDSRVPETLSRISMHALCADIDKRFASAAEMANALEAFVAAQGEMFNQSRVAALMQKLFPFDAQNANALPANAPVSTRQFQGQAELPTHVDSGAELTSHSQAHASEPVEVPRRDRRPMLIALGGFIGVAIIGASMGFGFSWRSDASVVVDQPPEPATLSTPPELPAVEIEKPLPQLVLTKSDSRSPQKRAHAKPSRGRLLVRVHPWAEVFLDSKSLGTTPLEPLDVVVGKHVIVLKNTDLNVERKMTAIVVSGKDTSINANLLDDRDSH